MTYQTTVRAYKSKAKTEDKIIEEINMILDKVNDYSENEVYTKEELKEFERCFSYLLAEEKGQYKVIDKLLSLKDNKIIEEKLRYYDSVLNTNVFMDERVSVGVYKPHEYKLSDIIMLVKAVSARIRSLASEKVRNINDISLNDLKFILKEIDNDKECLKTFMEPYKKWREEIPKDINEEEFKEICEFIYSCEEEVVAILKDNIVNKIYNLSTVKDSYRNNHYRRSCEARFKEKVLMPKKSFYM